MSGPRPVTQRLVDTPEGLARLTEHGPGHPGVGTLLLGHGAGGSRWTDDVRALGDGAVGAGWLVVLVDQPWRVAGRRVASPPASLDRAWCAVLSEVVVEGSRLVLGGRSAGARVACRTASVVGADGVLALSFPLHPPSRPERSRAAELAMPTTAGIPLHVIQGRTDPMGRADEVSGLLGPGATLDAVDGAHSLERAAGEVARSALHWLEGAPGGVGRG